MLLTWCTPTAVSWYQQTYRVLGSWHTASRRSKRPEALRAKCCITCCCTLSTKPCARACASALVETCVPRAPAVKQRLSQSQRWRKRTQQQTPGLERHGSVCDRGELFQVVQSQAYCLQGLNAQPCLSGLHAMRCQCADRRCVQQGGTQRSRVWPVRASDRQHQRGAARPGL